MASQTVCSAHINQAHPGTPLSDSTRYDYGLRFVETRKGRTKRFTDQALCDGFLDASPIHFWLKNEDNAEQTLQLIDGSTHGVTAQFSSLNKEQVPWQALNIAGAWRDIGHAIASPHLVWLLEFVRRPSYRCMPSVPPESPS
ncbi:hypothetical protein E4U35_004884 [Claviceps purpurea]|nr:hypothetical protein E4U35_004884 [Claviceps purpurea]